MNLGNNRNRFRVFGVFEIQTWPSWMSSLSPRPSISLYVYVSRSSLHPQVFKTFKDILDAKKNTIFPLFLSIGVFFAVDNVISRVIYKQQNPLILLILLTDSE